MGMTTNTERIGNFTSSEIYRLMKNGKAKGSIGAPAYEYVKEKNMERRLGRSLSDEAKARPLSWGRLGEKRVFDILPLSYSLFGDTTIIHPEIDFWSGSPDATKQPGEKKIVSDVKSPMTLKSFCNLVDYSDISEIRENHDDGEKYYWQLVSNAIITGSDSAELIVYVPYLHELADIRGIAINSPAEELNNYYWIVNANDDELPHLIEGRHYKNLNVISFDIPKFDKDALTERVLEMGKLLIAA